MRTATMMLVATMLLGPAHSIAQVPQMMNYQVMLTDGSDQPLADQAVTLVFRIYDDATAGWMTLATAPVSIIPFTGTATGSALPLLFSASSIGPGIQTRISTRGPVPCRSGSCAVNEGMHEFLEPGEA